MMNFHEKYTVEQVKKIARALGKLQACSLKKEATAVELQQDYWAKMAFIWPLDTYIGMFKGMVAFDSSEKTKSLMEKIDALLPVYHGANLPSTIHKQMGFRPVIVNADLHTGNVLIDKDTGELAALIDWQCTHLGVGVEDLHRIALAALTTEDRRASMPLLVEEMHKSMVENVYGAEPPYSLETLLLVSDLLYPHCALFFASIFIAIIKDKKPGISEEENLKRKEIKMDKVIGCLEDVVEFDIKNTKHMGNLKFKSD
ncbi:hypothetical protein PRIPAC_82413 [Pristionchus pacificus]|nr:hypothetical protein PRIPAC_82413 [Pristionchus pacificus]